MEGARPATSDDLEELAALWAEAIADLDGRRGGARLADSLAHPEPIEQWVEAALGDEQRRLVVGTLDAVVVGFGSAHLETARREPLGVIEVLYVEPAARAVGVGEAIMTDIVRWCAAQGCVGVDAPALPGSRPAKAFFEDHGFVTRLLVMHHALPGEVEE
jgi:GNAT superfamily N-acetyltransferase